MSWKEILKNKNNMNFITQQRKYLESTTALTQEQKEMLEDSLDAMQPFVNKENFYEIYIKPYLEMQTTLQMLKPIQQVEQQADKMKSKKEYVVISEPYESSSNQKEIEVYWGYGDGGEGESIATFTDKDRNDIYDWVENWLKKNGYDNIDIEYE